MAYGRGAAPGTGARAPTPTTCQGRAAGSGPEVGATLIEDGIRLPGEQPPRQAGADPWPGSTAADPRLLAGPPDFGAPEQGGGASGSARVASWRADGLRRGGIERPAAHRGRRAASRRAPSCLMRPCDGRPGQKRRPERCSGAQCD
ncbi:hypothetical protein GCM10010389_41750 [Streptomyces echinoruber]|uniref:Uncharacterized protein n=1 Tax=Streptomyces echinoruber TaxID=68898 RepID=A0A918RGM2_9ACTN|nr:hypothetical protein GCM10010389_41750 [Streptomyces echinoruber]